MTLLRATISNTTTSNTTTGKMFGLFKKKEAKREITFDYSSIGVDMHSHILPGIDDGAQNPQESIFLIKQMMEVGIKKFIATPHIMVDYYRNNAETITNALTILKAELEKESIDVEVQAAAEHYFDETFEKRIDAGELMIMGDNYVLFEFSFINQPVNTIPVVEKLKDKGYKPILAHPERYPYMDLEQFRNLHDWGVDFQMNTISLTGYYGLGAKKIAEQLIDNQLINFISSDMHHPRHAEAFKKALRMPYLEKLLFDYPLKNTLLK
ncbi:tyrosine-protein phosphatase [Mucilaginibacter sp. L3T2-6]|uniref:tyrosine-protein phosphatase n=1 Tax=Mucilaginibacter sp. L3T2-6 TaxID=3062491 RepID=UPI0026761DFA|nr:CpsB/CapC family capsule biosynthesis tyrosine phosphatase [Mucilaginibacter sp. L3T2-6]MDO3644584.1 capsular biosynthesis protein [Mucilaginibacter sp. L3T2-6]MDV6217044.1 CpsB/CapC family capsule biosynthesis tyrosine phosphatase [Mucilaginibacter sp. L3T2-6]